jgi:polar amino acid transport system substrate-binding protein
MKKLLCLLIILIFTLELASCQKENQRLKNIIDKGIITIVTSPDYPPFEFIDSDKSGMERYVGADIDLMKFIAQELGVVLKIEVADFDTTLASLSLGTGDLAISGYTYKPERANNYEMSISYYEEGIQGIMILKSNLEKYGAMEKLNVSGVKVGAQSGTLQADYVTSQLNKSNLELFTKIPDGITLLDNGAIKGIALAKKIADIIMAKNSNDYIFLEETFNVEKEDTELYVFAKKGETELIERINEIIGKVKTENLYEEWDKDATELAISLGLL